MRNRNAYPVELCERTVRLVQEHRSDRGSQYLACRYSERLAEVVIAAAYVH